MIPPGYKLYIWAGTADYRASQGWVRDVLRIGYGCARTDAEARTLALVHLKELCPPLTHTGHFVRVLEVCALPITLVPEPIMTPDGDPSDLATWLPALFPVDIAPEVPDGNPSA